MRLYLVLAWSWHQVSWPSWQDLLAKSIQIVIYIHFPADIRDHLVDFQVIIRIEELCRLVVGAWARYRFLLFILNLRVRVVKVDRHYLLWNRGPEGTGNLASNSFGQIETEEWIICCWGWL